MSWFWSHFLWINEVLIFFLSHSITPQEYCILLETMCIFMLLTPMVSIIGDEEL